ncbi:hypothetical protein, partial [Streptococcus pneumoniae]|uniref:hypothetical protein n=1 Tax=Streptococcus pneumoniae TaxID=1313 RepID=UPI0009912521
VLSLFIIGHMGLFFYTKISSIISIGDLPTTNIIESFLYSKLGGKNGKDKRSHLKQFMAK